MKHNPIYTLLKRKYYQTNHAVIFLEGVSLGMGVSMYVVYAFKDNQAIIRNIFASVILSMIMMYGYMVMRDEILSSIIKNNEVKRK